MSLHNQRSYLTLAEIIEAIDRPFSDGTWVGKNYSRGALVQDLKAILDGGDYGPDEPTKSTT